MKRTNYSGMFWNTQEDDKGGNNGGKTTRNYPGLQLEKSSH